MMSLAPGALKVPTFRTSATHFWSIAQRKSKATPAVLLFASDPCQTTRWPAKIKGAFEAVASWGQHFQGNAAQVSQTKSSCARTFSLI